MRRFTAYVLQEKSFAEFTVERKIRTDVHGHYTYMLQGVTDLGNKANALVNRRQWESFDVPAEERTVERPRDVRRMREKSMNAPKPKTRQRKCRRKVYDEELEKWIAERYGIDLDSLEKGVSEV